MIFFYQLPKDFCSIELRFCIDFKNNIFAIYATLPLQHKCYARIYAGGRGSVMLRYAYRGGTASSTMLIHTSGLKRNMQKYIRTILLELCKCTGSRQTVEIYFYIICSILNMQRFDHLSKFHLAFLLYFCQKKISEIHWG